MLSYLKMTTVVGSNYFKFLNLRLPLNVLKLNYHVHRYGLYRLKTTRENRYSTAAYKYAVSENYGIGKNDDKVTFKPKGRSDLESVDNVLYNIDWIAKRNGRIMMKRVVDALNMIHGKESNASIYGLHLLRCCKYVLSESPAKRIELVNQIWNRFHELGVPFDVRHYNALLEVHIRNNFSFNPTDILNSMEEQFIDPNKATCVLLMNKYCKDGNLGGASEILEYMKDKGFPANEEVFNCLIEGHLKNNDFNGAKDMIEVMNAANLKPTEDTYVLFACAYAMCGDKNQMMKYLNGESTNGIGITNENYLKVIEALASSGNDQYVEDVLKLIGNLQDYQAETTNLAIELIHKSHIETAYKLIINCATPQYNNGTNIFIKQLIKMEVPVSQIIHYSQDIFNRGLNNIILLNGAKAAVDFGNVECAFAFFKERLAQGYPVRVGYFQSLFSHFKEVKAADKIWLVLEKMSEIGIPAEFTLYIDTIFPAIGVPKPSYIIENIQKTNQVARPAYDALFVYYCNLGEIDHAFTLIQTVPVGISTRLDFKQFLDKYSEFSSNYLASIADKYLKILKHILENVEIFGRRRDSTEALKGQYLAHLILTRPSLYEGLLKRENLQLSQAALNACKDVLKYKSPDRLALFNKLTVTDLQNKIGMTIEEENSHLDYLKDQKLSCKTFLTERIMYHIKSKNIDRVSDLMSLYEKKEFQYSPLTLANLISFYSSAADLQKTKEIFSKLKNDFPSFKLDFGRVFDYASLLAKYTEFDETLNLLKDCLTEPYVIGNEDVAMKSIKRFSAAVTDTRNVEFVRSVQNLMMPLSKSLGSKTVFLEPLINVQLNGNDLTPAFDEYRSTLIKYRIPAGLKNILKRCINSGDKGTLQKVVDLTINYSGRSVALLELSVAFIETGNPETAIKVIQNLGHEADPVAVEDICGRMYNQNKLRELEQFIHAVKQLPGVDQEKLFRYLLKICAVQNDCKKALDIFNKLQDKVDKPASQTLTILIDLLKRNGHPIPSSVLKLDTSETAVPPASDADVSTSDPKLTSATENFTKFLEERNAELALNVLNQLKKGYIQSLPLNYFTDLIDLCVEKNFLKELSSNVHAMSYIIENSREILKPILEKYSVAGEIENFVSIANCFPDFSLRKIGFNSFLAHAYISAGKPENLLSELEERYDRKNKLFSIVAFEELLKFPALEDKVLNLAQKYLETKFDMPIAVVWAHYFTLQNYEKADDVFELCSKHNIFPIDNLINSKILRYIRENQNVSMGQKYVHFVKKANLRERVKTAAYGTVLDLLVMQGNHDEAVSLVLEAEKLQLPLHKHYQSTLITLKSVLEGENKPVPFNIPVEDFAPNTSSGL